MKIFIVLSFLSLLFVIGSALAVNAIGRNATTGRSRQDQGEENTGKKSDDGNVE